MMKMLLLLCGKTNLLMSLKILFLENRTLFTDTVNDRNDVHHFKAGLVLRYFSWFEILNTEGMFFFLLFFSSNSVLVHGFQARDRSIVHPSISLIQGPLGQHNGWHTV